jgi:predicted  nucleic acid-binding Zn-ribbon protein
MITAEDVTKAFDDLEDSFNELAKLEDRQTALVADLQEYAEGSRKAEGAKKKVQDLQPKLTAAQRAFRLAGMRADKVRMMLDVEKTAMGRD